MQWNIERHMQRDRIGSMDPVRGDKRDDQYVQQHEAVTCHKAGPMQQQFANVTTRAAALKRKRGLSSPRLPPRVLRADSERRVRIRRSKETVEEQSIDQEVIDGSAGKLDLRDGDTRPFDDDANTRTNRFVSRQTLYKLGSYYRVNSYLEFSRKQACQPTQYNAYSQLYPQLRSQDLLSQPRQTRQTNHMHVVGSDGILLDLRPVFKLDELNMKLFRFYMSAFSKKRTLLKRSNIWYQLVPIAVRDEAGLHALLALSAGYALDYFTHPGLLPRANYHHARARELLEATLENISDVDPDNHNAIMATLLLLSHDDIVQWELQRKAYGAQQPRWKVAAEVTKAILDTTAEKSHQWHDGGTQTSENRHGLACMNAYTLICAEPVQRLQRVDWKSLYTWLLQGCEADSREIYGSIGVSPKLLHMLAQITQLCARQFDDPEAIRGTWIRLAEMLLRRLDDFRQTSELTNRSRSAQQLLKECAYDRNGLVMTSADVTELSAQTWVEAVKIYLLCRFFRHSRTHPQVLQALRTLLQCLSHLPTNGDLFTAQTPFFCICIAALVATSSEDRAGLIKWFDSVLEHGNARSSVQPLYMLFQKYWSWVDGGGLDGDEPSHTHSASSISSTSTITKPWAWWERMVDWIIDNNGHITLI